MTWGLVFSKNPSRQHTINVNAFSLAVRVLFVVVVSALVVAEIIHVPTFPPPIYYPYQAAKLLGFVVVGILTPLAFWRFNALNRGLLYATLSAAAVETMQEFVHSGHSFHWYELVIKLVLILFGFSIGLDIRYERRFKIGPLHFVLHERH